MNQPAEGVIETTRLNGKLQSSDEQYYLETWMNSKSCPADQVGSEHRLVSHRFAQVWAVPMMSIAVLAGCGGSGAETPAQPTSAQVSCESLQGVPIAGGTIISAQSIPAGDYTPPGQTVAKTALPAFCRVLAAMTPTPDSRINVEVWLPNENWNGRFLGTGSGGGAGVLRYDTGLAEGLKRGFATAFHDLGTAPNINTTVGHPEKWVDFGHRSNHQMTLAGKALVNAYYKSPPRYSYFEGCSTGGQQALTIAQRYPSDYNGIIAGAPANNRTHLHTMFLWNYNALNAPGAKLTPAKLSMVTSKVVAACAGKDGGHPSDPFLTDPRQCNFDPDTLPKCTAGDADDCLTSPQLTALKKAYSGPVNPRTGERIYGGMHVGAESVNLGLAAQGNPATWPAQQFYPYYWVFGTGFDPAAFDFDRDMDTVDARLAPILNANSADLSAFRANGGKLIMYTGSSDPAVPMHDAINYYERVVQDQGGDLAATQQSFRYYIVPGMGHCAQQVGGSGVGHFGQPYSAFIAPDESHDVLLKMVSWVEKAQPPEEIIATRYTTNTSPSQVALERPICVYPKVPTYVSGDPTKASSFLCKEAARGNVPAPADRYLN